MNGLYYLAHLVQVKNDLNRKRRRFYALMNPGYDHFRLDPDDKNFGKDSPRPSNKPVRFTTHAYHGKQTYVSVDRHTHPAFTKLQAQQGYLQAQRDMKAMTAHMRKVRSEIGAKFIWGSGGQINAIKHENKVYWAAAPKRFYHPELQCEITANKGENQILALANQYRADQILLAD